MSGWRAPSRRWTVSSWKWAGYSAYRRQRRFAASSCPPCFRHPHRAAHGARPRLPVRRGGGIDGGFRRARLLLVDGQQFGKPDQIRPRSSPSRWWVSSLMRCSSPSPAVGSLAGYGTRFALISARRQLWRLLGARLGGQSFSRLPGFGGCDRGKELRQRRGDPIENRVGARAFARRTDIAIEHQFDPVLATGGEHRPSQRLKTTLRQCGIRSFVALQFMFLLNMILFDPIIGLS